jgi:hypothetical protein
LSNGNDPEPCDASCQAKIILNGDNAAALITAVCEASQHFTSNGGKLKRGKELIDRLNSLEDGAVELQQFFLRECVGYTGEVGAMLQGSNKE